MVVDASTLVEALTVAGPAFERLRLADQLDALYLIDSELIHSLRGLVRRGKIGEPIAHACISTWQEMEVVRHPATALMPRMWQLRHNLSGYDAGHVALAESLGATLVTSDERLARAPGPRCEIELIAG